MDNEAITVEVLRIGERLHELKVRLKPHKVHGLTVRHDAQGAFKLDEREALPPKRRKS
jgi:hypothetical protein